MSNPISSTLQELFRHLAFLTGILTHLENQHNNYSHLLKQELEQHGIDPSLWVSGSALTMRDLTQPVGNFRGHHLIGSYTSQNLEEYEKVLQVLLCRNSNWAVAQAYEAFETFLKNTISIYICENFDSVRMYLKKDIERAHKKMEELKSEGLLENEIAYWREFVSYARWNNKKILLKIRENFTSSLHVVEKDNRSLIDLPEWFDVVSELRHAVTHSNGVIVSKKINSHWSQRMINQLFPGKKIENGYKLQLNVSQAKHNLELFAEYGYAIFKCLSTEQKYTVDVI